MGTGGRTFETRVRVAYADTDQMAVVYHANYLVWFERGRTEAMRELALPYAALEARGLLLPVVEAGIHFHLPARYDDLLVIETVVAAVGAARIVFGYRVRRATEADPSRLPGEAPKGSARPSERVTSGGRAPRGGRLEGPQGPPVLVAGFTEHACTTREGRVVRLPDDVRGRIEPVVTREGSRLPARGAAAARRRSPEDGRRR